MTGNTIPINADFSSLFPAAHPFATAGGHALSINRARIVALPGITVDEGVLGHSAFELLSARSTRDIIRAAAGSLALSPDDPDLLWSFDRRFNDPTTRPTAVKIAQQIGRRLGFLLVMLRRGDTANRAARPEWDAAHWAYWAAVDRVVIGGGLWAGRMGEVALVAARALLQAVGDDVSVERSAAGAAVALFGLARHAPPDTRHALLLDFGQTAVKRGLATYAGGELAHVAVYESRPSPCQVQGHDGDSQAEIQAVWRDMATIVAEEWAAAIPASAREQSALNLCLATHLRHGHPFPTDRGCYGRLQNLTPHLATFMRDELAARIGPFRAFTLLQDGQAAASLYAGQPRVVVITFGTAIGAGYAPPEPPEGALRPLGPGFSVA